MLVISTAVVSVIITSVEGAHLVVVPLVVVLVVPPGVLLISDVIADVSTVADGKATADDKAMAGGEAVANVAPHVLCILGVITQ